MTAGDLIADMGEFGCVAQQGNESGLSAVEFAERFLLRIEPNANPEHYLGDLSAFQRGYTEYLHRRGLTLADGVCPRVRIHPRVIAQLGPKRVGDALGPAVRVVEAPPRLPLPSGDFWLFADDEDQDFA